MASRFIRGSLAVWAVHCGFEPARHHRLLIEKLEDVAAGKIRRLLFVLPPGSAKSSYASILFPPWYLAQKRGLSILSCSHSADLVCGFGRRCRNLISLHHSFLGYDLSDDSRAVDKWETTTGCGYIAAGVGAGIAGRRADLGLIDDPIGKQEDADSQNFRDKLWDWYVTDFRTRLKPDAAVVLIQCLTGDTKITMADGSWKNLENIKVGDFVTSYQGGKHIPGKVTALVDQGEDDVLEVRTGHARVISNARHPFLVLKDGATGWVKAGELKKGDLLVSSRRFESFLHPPSISNEQAWFLGYMFGDGWLTYRNSKNFNKLRNKYYPRRGYVTCAACSLDLDDKDLLLSYFKSIFGIVPRFTKFGYFRTEIQAVGRWLAEHGLTGNAHTKRLPLWLFSEPVEVRQHFLSGFNFADGAIFSTGYGKGRWTFGSCNYELIADIRQLARGIGYDVSNISIYTSEIKAPNSKEAKIARNVNLQFNPWQQHETPFIGDAVRSVKPAGRQRVYDLTVQGTECFLADGVVVHNTRWHTDDLAGRLLENEAQEWTVVHVPLIAEKGDVLGRKVGQRLWPEYFTKQIEIDARKVPRVFMSLYQGKPAAEEGSFFKKEWLVGYKLEDLPKELRYYVASDHALDKDRSERNDRTCLLPVGVDSEGVVWVLPDIWWQQCDDTAQVVDSMLDLMRRRKPIVWWAEKDAISRSIRPFLHQRMKETATYVCVEDVTPSRDKKNRARAIQGRMSMFMVRFPTFVHWWPEAMHELLAFDTGKHDDFVDALAYIGLGLDRLGTARAPKAKEELPKTLTKAWIKWCENRQKRDDLLRSYDD